MARSEFNFLSLQKEKTGKVPQRSKNSNALCKTRDDKIDGLVLERKPIKIKHFG